MRICASHIPWSCLVLEIILTIRYLYSDDESSYAILIDLYRFGYVLILKCVF